MDCLQLWLKSLILATWCWWMQASFLGWELRRRERWPALRWIEKIILLPCNYHFALQISRVTFEHQRFRFHCNHDVEFFVHLIQCTILVLLYPCRSDCKSKSYLRASGPSSKWVVPQRSGGALIWELKREFNFCNYQTSKHLWFAIQNFYPQKFQIRIQNERSLVEFLSFYFFTFLAWRKIFWNFWNENDLENNKRSIKRNIFDQ